MRFLVVLARWFWCVLNDFTDFNSSRHLSLFCLTVGAATVLRATRLVTLAGLHLRPKEEGRESVDGTGSEASQAQPARHSLHLVAVSWPNPSLFSFRRHPLVMLACCSLSSYGSIASWKSSSQMTFRLASIGHS